MKNLNLKILLSIVATAALSGCAPAYQPPTQGPIANLAFIPTNDLRNASRISLFDDSYKCVGRKNLNPHNLGSIKIPANKELALEIFWVGYDATTGNDAMCDLIGSFLPKEGRNYELFFRNHANVCSIQIGRRESNGGITQIPIKKRRPNPYELTAGEPACAPLQQ